MNNLNDLYLFTMVVRHQGISAAAKACNMPRSKVSRRIQELEASLGQALLIRTTRTIELTEKGQWLYQQINQSLTTANEAATNLKQQQGLPQGKLSIAIQPAFGTAPLFSDVVAEYVMHYPDVVLDIVHHQGPIDLRRNNIDLQILPDYQANPFDDYVQQQLLKVDYCIVASPQYIQKHGEPNTIDELLAHRLLVNRYAKTVLPEQINFHLYSDDILLLKKLTIAHQGISLLPRLVVQEFIDQQQLQVILPTLTLSHINLYLVYPSLPYLSEKTRLFIKLLRQYFSQLS